MKHKPLRSVRSATPEHGATARRVISVLVATGLVFSACSSTRANRRDSRGDNKTAEAVLSETCWTTTVDNAWSSSPNATDLTGDGVLDVVVGTNGSPAFVVAVDGANGDVLWKSEVGSDVYTSAAFLDSNGDSTPDVVMGGRSNDLFAFDGRTGSLLWSTRRTNPGLPPLWFGSATPVADVNGDGVADLLAPQSGEDAGKLRAGILHLISGVDGSVLRSDTTPDNREIYSPPALAAGVDLSGQDVYVGTGGESIPGAVTAMRYGSGATAAPRVVWTVPTDGVVAPPIVATIGGRKIVLASTWGGETIAIDAEHGEVIWRNHKPGHVALAPPVASVPETGWVIVSSSRGTTFPPVGEDTVVRWIDTQSGTTIREKNIGGLSIADPILFDFDDDGEQDLLVTPVANAFEGGTGERGRLLVLDAARGAALTSAPFEKFAASTPLIADLEGDGRAELIHAAYPGLRCYRLDTEIGADRVARGYRNPE